MRANISRSFASHDGPISDKLGKIVIIGLDGGLALVSAWLLNGAELPKGWNRRHK